MLKRLLIISLLLIFISATDTFSQDTKQRIRGPIVVTSETLTADNNAHTALFERNVVAKTTDMTIYADTMLVYYRENSGDVTKIESAGNVRVLRNTRIITSQKAVYYADEDKVIFTGDPRAVDGENVVTGTRMTYFINDDRSYVENSKVFLNNKKDR